MARDIKAHSPVWNFHCHRRQNANNYKDFIKKFRLLINNKPRRAIRPSNGEVSIIDFALLSSQSSLLTLWKIQKEYPSLSDYELIVLRWEDVDYNSVSQKCGKITGWDIQGLINDESSLQAAQLKWMKHTQNRLMSDNSCTRQELDEEVEWVETLLTHILNTHSKSMRVTLFSKRWWNKEVAKARKIWAREKKL